MSISLSFRDFVRGLVPAQEYDDLITALDHPLGKSISLRNDISADKDYRLPERSLRQPSWGQALDRRIWYVDREDRTVPLGKTRQHQTGLFYIQEAAASIPATCLDIPADSLVLDMCAAPGGKTAQLADRFARVWANEPDGKRRLTLVDNIHRMGQPNVIVSGYDGTKIGELFPESVDAVLLDAPCSGEGTAFKSATALQRRRPESVGSIRGTQRDLLVSALMACKTGGQIIYSTCTLNPRENECMIARLLSEYGDYVRLEPLQIDGVSYGLPTDADGVAIWSNSAAQSCLRCRPHRQHTGGFFVAKIVKIQSLTSSGSTVSSRVSKVSRASRPIVCHYRRANAQAIMTRLHQQYGIPLELMSSYTRYTDGKGDNQTYRVSTHDDLEHYGAMPVMPVVKQIKGGYILLHSAGQLWGAAASMGVYELDDTQCQSYVSGQDIEYDVTGLVVSTVSDTSFVLLRHRGRGIGVGKIISEMVKNKRKRW